MRLISVIIPTFRRPDLLPLAIESLLTQRMTSAQYEIIAVDNSPEGSAMPYLLNAQSRCTVNMVVLHEPRPGVAYARNTAFEAAKGELIAFLDDDTYGEETWLQSLLDTRDRFNAAMVFGPTIMHANDAPKEHRAYIEKLFSRLGPDEDKLIDEFGGASCSLHVRSIVFPENPPFPEHTNNIGGEDDALFHAAIKRGAKVAWSAKGKVDENLVGYRANLKYAYRRSFSYGQGACYTIATSDHVNYAGIAWHMMIGLGQLTVFGLIGGLAWALRLPNRAQLLDPAIRGAGKIIWWTKLEFYGAWMEKQTRGQKAPEAPPPAQRKAVNS